MEKLRIIKKWRMAGLNATARKTLRLLRTGILILPLLILAPAVSAAECPPGTAVCPGEVTGTLGRGGSLTVEHLVNVPDLPPTMDIFLLQDETASLNRQIAGLKTLAASIWDALAERGVDFTMGVGGFRDFARGSWGGPDDWVFRRLQDLTAEKTEFTAGINRLTAGTGNDKPEGFLEALHYIADPGHPAIDSNGDGNTSGSMDTPAGMQPAWREGSRRIVILLTDSTGHTAGDAGGWPGDEGTIDAGVTGGLLRDAGITVVGLTPGGAGTIGMIDALANITGGSVQAAGSSGESIKEAVMTGIGSVTSAVWWRVEAGPGLIVTPAPEVLQCAAGGYSAGFQTLIKAADDAAPGLHYATVTFLTGHSPAGSGSIIGTADIGIDVLSPCYAIAPDFNIDIGTVINDQLFIDHGARCSPGSTMTIVHHINNTILGPFPYTVTASDGFNKPVSASGVVTVVAPEKIDIHLDKGWNLISLPYYIEPEKGETADLLAGIMDNMRRVYAYDACGGAGNNWKIFSSQSAGGTLDRLEDGRGYWIYMEAPDVLTVTGRLYPEPPSPPPAYSLCPGWNLIGVRSNLPVSAGDYLASLAGKYVLVYRYSGGSYSTVRDNDLMLPGEGYWIAMVQPGLLQY